MQRRYRGHDMKKFVVYGLFITFLFLAGTASATTTVSVCNMPSTTAVQVRVYDITDAAEDVAWTNTGVTERAVGMSKSCYYYAATLETNHSYQIDWRDSGTPTKVASETVYEIQTAMPQVATVTGNVNGSVGSVTGTVGSVTGAVGSVTAGVTVSTNNDKTGYTVSTVQDKTGYALSGTQTFNLTGNITGNLSGSIGSVTGAVGSVTGAVTVGTNNDKTGYSLTQSFPTNFASMAITAGGAVTAGTVSDKTGYSLTQSFPTNFADLSIEAATGKVTATNPGTGATAQQVWEYVTRTLTSAGLVLPAFQASVATSYARQTVPVEVVKGDTISCIPFDLNADYTGWTAKFAAKEKITDTTYAIAVKDASWTNEAAGEGCIALTSSETNLTPGDYFAELKLYSGVNPLTAIKFKLKVVSSVFN